MRVLITGGAGYIGTELTYKLAENKDVEKIIVLDNFGRDNFNLFIGHDKLPSNKVEFVHGDLLDSRKVKKILENVDVVYHLAAKVTTPFADQNPHLFEQVNHWGTAELVYAIEQSNVKKFIYMSSVSVYGSSHEEVDIDSPINPRTFYGISKMRGEEHVQRLFNKLPTYILRCGNVYGYSKSMRFDAVINKFMFDANFTNRITINGNGEQYRAFVHIDRVTNVLNNILRGDIKSSRYDLVDENMTVNQIVEALHKIYPTLEMIFVNQHLRLRELKVKPNKVINKLMESSGADLQTELEAFKAAFSY